MQLSSKEPPKNIQGNYSLKFDLTSGIVKKKLLKLRKNTYFYSSFDQNVLLFFSKKKIINHLEKKSYYFWCSVNHLLNSYVKFSVNQVSFKEKMEAVLAQLIINWLILHLK